MSAMIIQFKDGTDYNAEKEYVPGMLHLFFIDSFALI